MSAIDWVWKTANVNVKKLPFYYRASYASAVLAVIMCLSVCLPVCPSVRLSATSRELYKDG